MAHKLDKSFQWLRVKFSIVVPNLTSPFIFPCVSFLAFLICVKTLSHLAFAWKNFRMSLKSLTPQSESLKSHIRTQCMSARLVFKITSENLYTWYCWNCRCSVSTCSISFAHCMKSAKTIFYAAPVFSCPLTNICNLSTEQQLISKWEFLNYVLSRAE